MAMEILGKIIHALAYLRLLIDGTEYKVLLDHLETAIKNVIKGYVLVSHVNLKVASHDKIFDTQC